MTACPCCGQTIKQDRLLVDLNSNTAAYGSSVVECRPPRSAEAAYILAERWPKFASLEDLTTGIWGYSDNDYGRPCVQVHISNARKPLKQLGVRIEAVVGRGYRLVMPWQPEVNNG